MQDAFLWGRLISSYVHILEPSVLVSSSSVHCVLIYMPQNCCNPLNVTLAPMCCLREGTIMRDHSSAELDCWETVRNMPLTLVVACVMSGHGGPPRRSSGFKLR